MERESGSEEENVYMAVYIFREGGLQTRFGPENDHERMNTVYGPPPHSHSQMCKSRKDTPLVLVPLHDLALHMTANEPELCLAPSTIIASSGLSDRRDSLRVNRLSLDS
jgi:hypothetical protein